MSGPSIPAGIDGVTTEWLTSALRRSGALPEGASVREATRQQVGEGVGVMGVLYRLGLTYDGPADGAPASVVVKLPSVHESNREQGVGLGMYEAEVRFYREVAARTTARIPRCFAAEIVSGTADFVLLLEDLSHLELGDQVAGLTPEQARASVDAIADVHASWWGRVQEPEFEWIPSVVHERIQGLAAMWPQVWELFAARYAEQLPPGGMEVGLGLVQGYWPVMQHLATRPWTLLHMDYRADNIMFSDTGEAAVVDWQGLGRGGSAYDLSYVIASGLAVEDRREHEEALVRGYLERVTGHGVPGLTWDELWRDYRLCLLTSTATPVLVGGTMDLGNERGAEMIRGFVTRTFTACVDHRSMELVPSSS